MTTNCMDPLERRYLLSTIPAGPELQISEAHAPASVAMDAQGGFIVAWSGGARNYITLRRFTPAGLPIGDEFLATEAEWCYETAIAIGPDGGFVVVWEQFALPGADGKWL